MTAALNLSIETESPPIRPDGHGGLRIGQSRVLLEMVIYAFKDGATPEAIVQAYSSVTLPEVYGVIAYYLRHRPEIERYLDDRERQSDEMRKLIEARQGDLKELRERLLARQNQK